MGYLTQNTPKYRDACGWGSNLPPVTFRRGCGGSWPEDAAGSSIPCLGSSSCSVCTPCPGPNPARATPNPCAHIRWGEKFLQPFCEPEDSRIWCTVVPLSTRLHYHD